MGIKFDFLFLNLTIFGIISALAPLFLFFWIWKKIAGEKSYNKRFDREYDADFEPDFIINQADRS